MKPLINKQGDVRELTLDDFKKAIPLAEVDPELANAKNIKARSVGRPKLKNPKQQVTLRLDAEVIEHFKSQGKGWQTRINQQLVKDIRA